MTMFKPLKIRNVFGVAAVLITLSLAAALTITGCQIDAEDPPIPPPPPPPEDVLREDLNKYQFRSVWISTAWNIDLPPSPVETQFRNRLNAILDTVVNWNMNAIIFQVSPMLDAFWPSQVNPWSEFLTGGQGNPVVGDWDPLAVMIELTHSRGLEFHAWFNPYRVTGNRTVAGFTQAQLNALSIPEHMERFIAAGHLDPDNFAVQNPHFVYRNDGLLWLDPGFPEVRQHVVNTIMEVVLNYDVDAIHFDDYFYPFTFPATQAVGPAGGAGVTRSTFEQHGLGQFSDNVEGWGNWLRHNNDEMIRKVGEAIRAENERSGRAGQLGVSPFGIWDNDRNQPGIGTPGLGGTTLTNTGGVWADTRRWVIEEMVDYMAPQIYWEFTHAVAPYEPIARWWAQLHEGRNVSLYIGLAHYKHRSAPFRYLAAWQDPTQLPRQMDFNMRYPSIRGEIFFTFQDVNRATGPLPWGPIQVEANSLLRTRWQQHMTIIPPMPWLGSAAPAAPVNVTRNGNEITWEIAANSTARYFVVYRVTTATPGSNDSNRVIRDPGRIIARIHRNPIGLLSDDIGPLEFSFVDDEVEYAGHFTYIVTAFNAAHVESAPAVAGN